MKSNILFPLLFCLLAIPLFSQSNFQQSLSVNSDGSAAAASALLDLSATDKGVLVPRMTSAQRTAIASPATGLLVFDSDTGGFWFYSGTAWTSLSGGGGGGSYTGGAGINVAGTVITNTGDTNAADDLTTASTAGGDLAGVFSNLQIAADAVGAAEIATGAVGSAEIADGTVAAADLAPGIIPTSLPPSGAAGGDLTGTYPNPTVAANAIGSAEILNATILADDLAPGIIPTSLPPSGSAGGDLTGTYPNPTVAANAVTTAEILDATILAADLAPGIIPTSLPPSGSAGGDLTGTYPNPTVAANAIGSAEILNATILADDLAPGIIPTSLPPSGAAGGDLTGTYPNPTVAANAIGAAEIADGTVAAADLASNAVTTAKILDATILAADLAAGVIPPSLPPNGAAGGDLSGTYPNPIVGSNAIGSAEITDGTVAAIDLAPGTLPTSLPPSGLAGGDLSGSYPNPVIAPGAVGLGEMASNSVGSSQILDGTVAAADLAPMGATAGQALVWTGASWTPGTLSKLQDADADTKIQAEKNPDEDVLRFDVAGSERLKITGDSTVLAGSFRLKTGSMSISPGGAAPAASAMLDLQSTSRGMLAPRMTSPQRIGIASPATGLLVFDITQGGFYYYNGSAWTSMRSALTLADADNDTKVQVEETADEDVLRVDLAGSERLVLKTTTTGGSLQLELIDDEDNTFVGQGAGNSSNPGAVGGFNTLLGKNAGYNIGAGYYNTAVGYQALNGVGGALFTGNTVVGYQAMLWNDTGGSNTAVGFEALNINLTGNSNTAVGYHAGDFALDNGVCTFLGDNANTNSSTDRTNSMALGNDATVSANNQVRVGNSSVTSIGGYADWTNVSDERVKTAVAEDVAGLDFILRLRPVTYQLDVEGIAKALNEDRGVAEDSTFTVQSRAEKSAARQTGFLAQEVESAAGEAGFDFSGVDAPQNEESLYGLRYAQFVVPLVKGMQEQQGIIEAQRAEISTLQSQLVKISAALAGAGIAVEK